MTPKAEIKQNKKEAVTMLTEAFKNAKSVTFVDYSGMSVSVQGNLRNLLRNSGAHMLVAKNTLAKIAAQGAGAPSEVTEGNTLSGQIAIVFGDEDAVSPIQVLGKFSKENELPKFKFGIVEGLFQDAARLEMISKMPSRQELQASAVGAIGAPIYGLLGTLQGNMQKLVFILEQAKAKASN